MHSAVKIKNIVITNRVWMLLELNKLLKGIYGLYWGYSCIKGLSRGFFSSNMYKTLLYAIYFYIKYGLNNCRSILFKIIIISFYLFKYRQQKILNNLILIWSWTNIFLLNRGKSLSFNEFLQFWKEVKIIGLQDRLISWLKYAYRVFCVKVALFSWQTGDFWIILRFDK